MRFNQNPHNIAPKISLNLNRARFTLGPIACWRRRSLCAESLSARVFCLPLIEQRCALLARVALKCGVRALAVPSS